MKKSELKINITKLKISTKNRIENSKDWCQVPESSK